MPELPEVETILQGLSPQLIEKCVERVEIRQSHLRWEIPPQIKEMEKHVLLNLERRAKYLLFRFANGTAIAHLGMSGSYLLLSSYKSPQKHDHYDIVFEDCLLRYRDPRRFGTLLWTTKEPELFPLLAQLGFEPLDDKFNATYLYQLTRGRKTSIKQLIMNSRIVVGIGNIYAAESLFLAKIHPLKPAGNLTQEQCHSLCLAIKQVITKAISQGGTTLRDFKNSEGKPGYFAQKLSVYGRGGQKCSRCQHQLENISVQNRSTVFCPSCQK